MSSSICAGRRYRDVNNPRLLPLSLETAPALSSGHPEGGRHGCRPFSDQAMDGLSENGDGTARVLSGVDVARKVLSFGYFSLHQQRKVTRLQAKAFDLLRKQDQTHFALAGEVLSFAGPLRRRRERRSRPGGRAPQVRVKESTQRKRPSPTTRSGGVECRSHFRTRHPWLGPKTAAIHGGLPPWVRMNSRLVVCGKSTSRAEGAA